MAIDVTLSGLNTVVDVAPSIPETIDVGAGQIINVEEHNPPASGSTVSGLDTVVDVTMQDTAPIDADSGQVIVIEDYENLHNKPSINNVTLDGNKTSAQIGVADANHAHDAFVGTDGVSSGTAGFVPAPTASDSGKVLGADGTWVTGGGGGGVTSYNDLTDKPSIEGVTLSGNKTFPQLNLDALTNTEIEDIFNDLI